MITTIILIIVIIITMIVINVVNSIPVTIFTINKTKIRSDNVQQVGQHIGLGRTVSDSQTKLRRKLESEDSSYDSDHEGLVASLSNFHPLSRSHDDISRTPSETLAQVQITSISRVAFNKPFLLRNMLTMCPPILEETRAQSTRPDCLR